MTSTRLVLLLFVLCCQDLYHRVHGEMTADTGTAADSRCPQDLPQPSNGNVSYSQTSIQMIPALTANYVCELGYVLNGNRTRTCKRNNGTWDGSDPTCDEIICPELSTPANGQLIFSRPFNSTARYSCNDGYTLQGAPSRTCQADGTWSGSNPTCNEMVCSDLPAPANGGITHSSGSTDNRPFNSFAMYSCQSRYTLEGTQSRTCRRDGTWTGFDPMCIRNGSELDIFVNATVTEKNFQAVASDTSDVTADSVSNTSLQSPQVLELVSEVFGNFVTLLSSPTANISSTDVDNLLKSFVSTQNALVQWDRDNLDLEMSSNVVESFDTVVSAAVQQQSSKSMTLNNSDFTLITELDEVSRFMKTGTQANFSSTNNVTASIVVPAAVFNKANTGNQSIGVFHALYENPNLFVIRENIATLETRVGTPVIATTVGQGINITDIDTPITIELELMKIDNKVKGSERCVSWDFTTDKWVTDGCKRTRNEDSDTIIKCECTHLTNFAVLIDICSRTQDCETDDGVDVFLQSISYIGVVLSCIGLFLTIVTLLAFKELRQRDNTAHTVQLCIAIFILLFVFAAGIDRTENFGGCATVSVLIHYFSLVAVMWMGAEAVLMFQKLVIIFGVITKKYFVIVSLVCWLVPLVPVMIPLIFDVHNGTEPDTDLIIDRNATDPEDGYCFLKHEAVFFAAFLGPIIVITLLNLFVFVWITVIVLRSTKRKLERASKKFSPKTALRVMTSLMGVVVLFGLTWLFAAFTFTIAGNNVIRYIFLVLFVIFSAFQGVYIFLFFCVLDKKARKVWRKLFCKKRTSKPGLTSSSSTLDSKKTEYVHVDTMHYMKPPYIPELEERLSNNGDNTAV